MRTKTDYKIICPGGEVLQTIPGKKGLGDCIILATLPKQKFAYNMVFIGAALRLKGIVEDRAYPRSRGKEGREKLRKFMNDCIDRDESLESICRRHQIDIKGASIIGEDELMLEDEQYPAMEAAPQVEDVQPASIMREQPPVETGQLSLNLTSHHHYPA
jgi:hypothetical protein